MTVRLRLPIARVIFAPIRHRYRGWTTEAEVTGRTIRIDPRGSCPAKALLHEYLHILHPSWSESKVRGHESKLWRQLSWRQKAALYKRLGEGRTETSYED